MRRFRSGIFACFIIAMLSTPGFSQRPPSDPKSIFEDSQRALLAHDYSKAELGFRKYLELDPRSAGAYSNLGVVYLRLGRYDSAIQAFNKAKALAPDLPQIDLNLGLAYYREEDFANA